MVGGGTPSRWPRRWPNGPLRELELQPAGAALRPEPKPSVASSTLLTTSGPLSWLRCHDVHLTTIIAPAGRKVKQNRPPTAGGFRSLERLLQDRGRAGRAAAGKAASRTSCSLIRLRQRAVHVAADAESQRLAERPGLSRRLARPTGAAGARSAGSGVRSPSASHGAARRAPLEASAHHQKCERPSPPDRRFPNRRHRPPRPVYGAAPWVPSSIGRPGRAGRCSARTPDRSPRQLPRLPLCPATRGPQVSVWQRPLVQGSASRAAPHPSQARASVCSRYFHQPRPAPGIGT